MPDEVKKSETKEEKKENMVDIDTSGPGAEVDLPEDKTKEEIIKGAIELIDPMFDHPWCWLNMPDEILREAKEMWSMH